MFYQAKTPFKPGLLLKNGHVNTFYRYIFTNIQINYKRYRLELKDGDFLDLDFSFVNGDKVVVAVHGLEGSSDSSYIRSLTHFLNQQNYDVIAINLRSCSGEPNRLLGAYHSGKSDDLLEVIQFIEKEYAYKNIHVVGYSLGGNITLKFMAEFAQQTKVNSAVTVSVPVDIAGSAAVMASGRNKIYLYNFLKTLKVKAKVKAEQFPEANLNMEKINKAVDFKGFDDQVTAPINGFIDAEDYWQKVSAKQFLKDIKKPSLLINALDDPFLSESCYPYKEAEASKYFYLLTTKYGGHVGFCSHLNMKKNNWLENQILTFIKNNN